MNGGAFWLIVLPLVAASVVYFVRHTFLAGLITAAWTALVAWILYLWPAGVFWVFGQQVDTTRTWRIAGLAFQLTKDTSRSWVFMAYLVVLGLGVLAVILPEMRPGLAWGNLWLSALAALWLSSSVWQEFFFVVVAAAIVSIGLAGPPSSRGAWRVVLFPALAYPLVILAHRYASIASLRPGDPHPLAIASIFLSVAIFPLLLLFPFHGAFPAVGEEAHPTLAVLWAVLWPAAIQALLVQVSRQLPWWTMESGISWITWAVYGTLVWASLASLWQRKPGRLWGYAALTTWVLLLRQGEPSWGIPMWRGCGLVAAAVGIAGLNSRARWKLLPRRVEPLKKWCCSFLYVAAILALAYLVVKSGGASWEGTLRITAGIALAVGVVPTMAHTLAARGAP